MKLLNYSTATNPRLIVQPIASTQEWKRWIQRRTQWSSPLLQHCFPMQVCPKVRSQTTYNILLTIQTHDARVSLPFCISHCIPCNHTPETIHQVFVITIANVGEEYYVWPWCIIVRDHYWGLSSTLIYLKSTFVVLWKTVITSNIPKSIARQ